MKSPPAEDSESEDLNNLLDSQSSLQTCPFENAAFVDGLRADKL